MRTRKRPQDWSASRSFEASSAAPPSPPGWHKRARSMAGTSAVSVALRSSSLPAPARATYRAGTSAAAPSWPASSCTGGSSTGRASSPAPSMLLCTTKILASNRSVALLVLWLLRLLLSDPCSCYASVARRVSDYF